MRQGMDWINLSCCVTKMLDHYTTRSEAQFHKNKVVPILTTGGPRPEKVEHVEIFTKEISEFSYRLRVKAGLTGYAQIYGKYNTSARDKLLLDLLYIEQRGFLLDAKIIFLTVKTMFTPEATEGFDEEKAKQINQKSNLKKEIENMLETVDK